MAYEQRDMNGSVFKNKRKEKDTHPDYTGSVRVDGVDYWQSFWIKKDKNGETWLSQELKRKDNQMASLRDELRANNPQAPQRGPSDDMPF